MLRKGNEKGKGWDDGSFVKNFILLRLLTEVYFSIFFSCPI